MDLCASGKCYGKRKSAIVLFGRLPTPGKAKTRLGRSIGNDAAAGIYKDMAEGAIASACRASPNVTFLCSEENDVPEVEKWIRSVTASEEGEEGTQRVKVGCQSQSADLGERLRDALQDAFSGGNFDEVIIAGTDIPNLSPDVFVLGFLRLRSFDVVLGPSDDGGYYMVGVRQNRQANAQMDKFFQGIHWSTRIVYREQVKNAESLNLSVCPHRLLPSLSDIDTFEDAKIWLEKMHKASPSSFFSQNGAGYGDGDDGASDSKTREAKGASGLSFHEQHKRRLVRIYEKLESCVKKVDGEARTDSGERKDMLLMGILRYLTPIKGRRENKAAEDHAVTRSTSASHSRRLF